MTRLTAADGDVYRLVSAHDRSADETPIDFLDERDAQRLLTELAEDGFNQTSIRRFADEDITVLDLHPMGDEELWEYLAAGLVAGRLQLVKAGQWKRRTSLGRAKPAEPDEPEEEEDEAEAPPPPPEEKTWVKFEIVDEETGKPVKGVTLKVKLPDGQTRIGRSDASGLIEFKDIPPGSCEIERMLDADTLEVVSVE